MEILGKILGSDAKVRIMRLFLLNKDKRFKTLDIAKRSRINVEVVRRELRILSSIGFVKKRAGDFIFNPLFQYVSELEQLLINTETVNKQIIIENLKKVGRVKLVLISGIFIKNKDSRVDMLIVGDGLKKAKIEEEIRKLEAEIGAELVYAIFNSKEFIYRYNMYDKLVRDILDFPHEVLIHSKELSLVKVSRQA
ncbi:hypothetical protein HZA26_01390 [Candidatus Nomurabacteria bacterium]|nr:hypothetical protein [Candidatus Nomurabacteria bacterium]